MNPFEHWLRLLIQSIDDDRNSVYDHFVMSTMSRLSDRMTPEQKQASKAVLDQLDRRRVKFSTLPDGKKTLARETRYNATEPAKDAQ